jgi:hypothetical protein
VVKASDGLPPTLEDIYFDIAASIFPRSDGQPGFFAEIDDPANPIAGVSAVGPDMASTRDLLLKAAWSALQDPCIRWMTGLDGGVLAGVRLRLTSHHRVSATDLNPLTRQRQRV